MELAAGASAGAFLIGTAATAINHSARLVGERLEVRIDAGPSILPFLGPEGGAWQFRLRPDVPMQLSVQAGASQLDLDLSNLQVSRFSYDGGASSLRLTLPARVPTALMEIQAGAASIEIRAPETVAVRFRTKSVGSLHVNESRFPRLGAGLYQSADYDSAAHRIDIVVDGGATSIQLS